MPCKTLTTIIAVELGHKSIALLKIDAEGSEYTILDDLLQSDLQIRQILVDFTIAYQG